MDYVRTHWHLNTSGIDDAFFKQISARSNNEMANTEALFTTIRNIQAKQDITQEELEKLSNLIDDYKQKQAWKTTI